MHYGGHDSAFMFYDNAIISLLMCVCRITIKGYLVTYLLTRVYSLKA